MSKVEHRKGSRINVRIPTTVYLENRKIECEIVNLSAAGAYVHCDADWKVGQEVRVELHFRGKVVLPGRTTTWEELREPIPEMPREMSAQTVVRWTAVESQQQPAGFGVEFTDLQRGDQELLQKIIRYYDNLKKAGVTFE